MYDTTQVYELVFLGLSVWIALWVVKTMVHVKPSILFFKKMDGKAVLCGKMDPARMTFVCKLHVPEDDT